MESCKPNPIGWTRFRFTCEGIMENVGMIGLNPREVAWLRLVVSLLRHPDPVVVEVARGALQYLEDLADRADQSRAAG